MAAAEMDDGGCASPVYDYASDEDLEVPPTAPAQAATPDASARRSAACAALPTSQLPVSSLDPAVSASSVSPTLTFAPTPSHTQHSQLATPTQQRRGGFFSPSSVDPRSGGGGGAQFSASSVRTLVSSAAATVIAPLAPPSPNAAAPRNLADVFDPIQLSPSPLAAAPASQVDEPGSQLVSRPTPPPARVSWPISFSNSKAAAPKSSRAKRKLPSASGLLCQTETTSGSRFAPCPMCDKTVALFDIERHLDNGCDLKVKAQKKDDVSASQLKRTPSFKLASPMVLNETGSSFTRCPLCDISVPLATINHHMDIECRTRKPHAAHVLPFAAVEPVAPTSGPSLSLDSSGTPAVSDPKSVSPVDPDPVLSGPGAPTSAVPTPPVADSSQSDPPASAESIAASSPHPFFTAGPRAASAFVPQRKGRNDHVQCALVSYFSFGCASPAPTAPPAASSTALDLFRCEWQDCDEATVDSTQSQQLSSSHASAPFHTNTKCHEPSVELWANICVQATDASLRTSPVIDLRSPQLLCNARQSHRFRLTLSVLKSMLQKSVRLSRPAAAVRIALQLMHTDMSQFLRRISIIMFEDGILHPQLPLVVWMMLACGKRNLPTPFQPTHAHVNALLQMVHDIAAVSTKDALLPGETVSADSTASAQRSHSDGDEVDADDDMSGTRHSSTPTVAAAGALIVPPTLLDALPSLTPEQRLLIKCMLVRACFGGMGGDVVMMRSYAALWCKRFESENLKLASASNGSSQSTVRRWLPFLTSLHASSHTHLPSHLVLVAAIDVRQVTYLRDDDLVLSGIDFHCSNIVPQLLKKESTLRVLQQHGFIGSATPPPVVDSSLASMFASLKSEIDLTAKRILQRAVEM